MFDGIRSKIGYKKLYRELREKKRVPAICNLEQASKIAIIYRVEDEKVHNIVKNYVKFLKEEEGISNIKAMAYFDGKESQTFLQSNLHFDFFTRKVLNFHGRPAGINIDNFCNEQFDILIDLTEKPCLPLRFVLMDSKASLKVGRYSKENEPHYDLMIEGNFSDLPKYIEQVTYYLAILNNKSL